MKSSTRQSSAKNFRDSYVLGKTLGKGNFSVVRKCRHKFSKSFYAAKIILLDGNEVDNVERKEMIGNEVQIARELKHENILQFVDVFHSKDRIIMITHINELGDIYDFIANQDQISEKFARLLALEICSAVNYMHSKKIVHRDIKPENFLLNKSSTSDNYSVKLCDFGLAEKISIASLTRVCGSPSFVAPEVLNMQPYGLPIDVWSMGIVFYFLLCRFCPYEHEELRKKFDLILVNDLSFPLPYWEGISGEAKDLIMKMLRTSPCDRLTANQVMYDKWFQLKDKVVVPSKKGKLKVSLKAAATVITAARVMLPTHIADRQDAVLSTKLLQQTFTADSAAVRAIIDDKP